MKEEGTELPLGPDRLSHASGELSWVIVGDAHLAGLLAGKNRVGRSPRDLAQDDRHPAILDARDRSHATATRPAFPRLTECRACRKRKPTLRLRRPVRYNPTMTSTGAVQADLPLTTAQELPGAQVAENLGLCFGLIVRSMGLAKGFTASFSAMRSGEVSQYTEVLEDSRRHAVDRMIANAHVLGADAIIAVRFDSSEMGQNLTEILAYGTAVKLAR